MEELTEKPQHVSVHVLSSTTALMSWTSPQENYNSTIVSVVSLTCQKQKESQRLEKQYCTQVKGTSPAEVQPPGRCKRMTAQSKLRLPRAQGYWKQCYLKPGEDPGAKWEMVFLLQSSSVPSSSVPFGFVLYSRAIAKH